MKMLDIANPFNAPIFYKETVTSTMDEARRLTAEKHGTVIAAGEQTLGRGRAGRRWAADPGEVLVFTVLLRYGTSAAIPPALTLRAGLAVARGVEDCFPFLAGRVLVKWPNDVMIAGFPSVGGKDGIARKAVGILTEAEDGNVYVGIGVNVAQKTFPPELAEKACSIAQALLELTGSGAESADSQNGAAAPAEKRFLLLEKILFRLHEELSGGRGVPDWRTRLEQQLYMKGRRIRFVPGLPEELALRPAPAIEGILCGIGEGGEILITRDSGETVSCMSGELKFL